MSDAFDKLVAALPELEKAGLTEIDISPDGHVKATFSAAAKVISREGKEQRPEPKKLTSAEVAVLHVSGLKNKPEG